MSTPKWAIAPSLIAVSTAIAVLTRLGFDRIVSPASGFLTPFLFPVVVAALYGGTRWGLLATAINTAIVVFFFTPQELGFRDFDDRVRVGTFVILGGLVSALTGRLRHYRRLAEVVADALTQRNESLAQEVAERRETAERLAESERRYRMLLEGVPQLVWTCRPDGWCDYLSRQWVEYTGVPEADQLGYGWSNAVHPDDRAMLLERWQQSVRTGEPLDVEFRIRSRSGDYRWFKTRAVRFQEPDGESKWFGTNTDIHDQKQAEAELKESERTYRAIGESIDYGVWVCDPDGKNTYASPSFLKLVGITQEQCSEFGWGDTLHPDDAEATILAWKECVRVRGIWDREHRFRGVDGQYHPVLARGVPVEDDHGKLLRWAGINLDISRQKHAESALRELNAELERLVAERTAEFQASEERLRLAVQAAGVGVWEWEVLTNRVHWNDQMFRMYQVAPTPDGFVTYETWSRVVLEEDLAYQESLLADTIQRRGSGMRAFRIRWPDGQCRFIEAAEQVRSNADGRAEWVVGINLDVTARKQAEETVRESEALLASFFEAPGSLRGVIELVDGDIVHLRDNAESAAFFGRSQGEMRNRRASEMGVPDDAIQFWIKQYRESQRTNQPVQFEFAVPGGGRWLQVSVSPLDSHPRQRFSYVAWDVTERKKAEELRWESEQRFRSAFDHAPIGMALVAPDGRWLRVNRLLCQIFGYSADELLATDFQALSHPDDLIKDLDLANQVLAGTLASYQLEKRYFHKDGHVIHTLLAVSLVRDSADRPAYYVSHIKDISQQKEAERALSAQDALLRQFIKHSPAAIAMFDREVRYVQTSDRWLTDYHLGDRNVIGLSHYDVFPDTSEHWKIIHQRVLEGAVEGCEEDPFLRADGSTEWLQWECRPWHAASGEIGGLIMFTQVITERKRAAEVLRASEERFRVLFEQSSDAHLIFGESEGILDCNPAAVSMLRCQDKSTLLRLHPAELSPEFQPDGRRSLEKCIEMDATARRNGYHRFDWDHRRMDGEVFPCEVTLTPITLDGKSVILVVWHELTERKRAEQALRDSEEQFRAAMEGSLDSVFFLTADRAPTGIIQDFRFSELNRRGCNLLSRSREQVIGQRLCELLPVNRTAGFFNKFVRVVETGEPLEEEFTVSPSDGLNATWIRHQVIRVRDGVAITSQDITARKQAEAALRLSEERFRRLVDGVADHAIFMLDTAGHVISWNPGAEQIKGYTAEEVLGQHFSIFYPPEVIAAGHPQHELKMAEAKGRYCEEGERVRKDGSRCWEAVTISTLRDDTGRHVGFVKFTHDITQRKQSEEQVRASLREKDVLLKEIHHRVKNNLQIISALLHLQSANLPDPAVREMFNDSRGRVKSMALIHERLYRSGDLTGIDFSEYIRQLAADLYRAYRVSQTNVKLELNVTIPPLPIDTAIPCGLLLNEMLSNCLKHAFKGRDAGRITVDFRKCTDGNLSLSVGDDGVGFMPGYDWSSSTSFGLQLIHTLAEQLNGHAQLITGIGSTATVTFPAPREALR